MANRTINFFDGSESATIPSLGNISASDLVKYADDATYEASEAGAPVGGNIYYNTTDNVVRYYNGSAWVTVVADNVVDSDFTISDNVDTSKKFQFEVSSVSTGVTRILTVPDADTTIVGTDTTDALTNKTIDANNNTITNLEHGNEVDNPVSGVHGVTGNVVGTSDTQTLTNKTVGDDLDVQGATSSTTPTTGALTVTGGVGVGENLNVGGDLEVTGNLTVNGTQTTVNTATLDVEDENITVNKNGTQSSADGAAGLTVEMSDATNVGLIYDQTLQSRFKVGDIGSEEEVVTVDAAQRVTGKDIDLGTASNDVGITVSQDTTANLTALTREAGRIYWSTDELVYYGDNGVELVPIGSGSGGGGLDVFYAEDFEDTVAADFVTGNNPTPDGAGTGSLAGTLSDQTVSPLAGESSLQYQAAIGSIDDFFLSPEITVAEKQQNNFVGLSFYYTTSAADDATRVVIYDETNDVELSGSDLLLKSASTSTRFETSVYIPDGVTSLRVGFQHVAASLGVLVVDDIQLSTNPFVYKSLVNETHFSALVSNAGSASITSENQSGWLTSATRTAAGQVDLDWSGLGLTQAPTAHIEINDPTNTFGGAIQNVTATGGTVRTFAETTGAQFDKDFAVTIHLQGSDYTPNREHVVTAAESSETVTNILTADVSATTDPISDLTFNNLVVGQKYFVNGIFPTQLSQSDTADIEFVHDGAAIYRLFADSTSATGSGIYPYAANFIFTATATSLTVRVTETGDMIIFGNGTLRECHVQLTNLTSQFLAAIPVQETAYIKDVKPNATLGGTFTSGAWQTRDLNTLSGDTSWVSLSSNQFTLSPGKYKVSARAPAVVVGNHKAKIRNITDGTDEIIGSSTLSNSTAANTDQTDSRVSGVITLSTSKTFELQHRCAVTRASNGFGTGVNFGVDEVFSEIEITKVK